MIRICAINCKNVSRWADGKFEFRSGLNLVIGPNEAGKSALLRSIAAVLFGTMDQSLMPVGFSGNYGAALKLAGPKGEFIIDRNFADNRVQIHKIVNGKTEPVFDAKVSPRGRSADVIAYQKWLTAQIGLADRDLFEASVLLHHHDFSLGQAETVRKIKQILAGQATHDYDAVLDGLWNRWYEVTSENPNGRNKTKARTLELLQAKRKKQDDRRLAALQGFERCRQLQDQIDRDTRQQEKIRQKSQSLERLVKVAADYFQFEQERMERVEQHKKFAEEKRRVEALIEQVQRVEKQRASLGIAADIDDGTAEKLRRKITLDEQTAQRKEKLAAMNDDLSAQAVSAKGKVIGSGIAAAIFAGAAGLLAFFTEAHYAAAPGALAFAAIVFLFMTLKSRSGAKSILQAQIAGEERALTDLQEQSASLDIPGSLLAMSPEELSAVLAQRETAGALLREKEKYQAQLEVLPAIPDVEQVLSSIEREIAVLENRKGELAAIHPELKDYTHDKLINQSAQLNDLDEQYDKLQQEKSDRKEQYAALAAVTENPEWLGEQIDDLDRQIELLEEKRDATGLAIEAVSQAVEKFRGEFLVDFSKEVGTVFGDLIDDSDRNVAISQDLALALKTEQGELDLDKLSAGTRDQLYFAGRVALAGRLSGKQPLPLLLDDPLVNFDQHRKQRALGLLQRLSEKHQVILFSHDARLAKWAGEKVHVIELDRH